MMTLPLFVQRLSCFVLLALFAIITACGQLPKPAPQSGNGQEVVLLVNSDASINRYRIPAESFKSALTSHAIVEVDLGEHSDPIEALQDHLNTQRVAGIHVVGAKALGAINYLAPNAPVVYSGVLSWRQLQEHISIPVKGVASDVAPKAQLIWLKYFFPELRKLGVLYSEDNEYMLSEAHAAADELGIKLYAAHQHQAATLQDPVQEILTQSEALWLISDPAVIRSEQAAQRLFALAEKTGKPIFGYKRLFVDYGATLTIHADEATIGRQAAIMLSRWMAGSHSVPEVQYPAGTSISLNMDKVKSLKLRLNADALDSVAEIIESAP
ncbi:MAG: ABC transporter substrate binding protein [Oleiphilaceae bacterium]|nr:ABC transporter substrate binding protein [Oleiphilaceae bacterium]